MCFRTAKAELGGQHHNFSLTVAIGVSHTLNFH